jgi:alkylated DNA nucleotide flippase Atl1
METTTSTEKVYKCCRSFPHSKLSTDEIAMLTNLPQKVVEEVFAELKKKEKLPIQYLTHILN